MEIQELQSFTPYKDIMSEYAQQGKKAELNRFVLFIYFVGNVENRKIEFISFPIQDQSTHRDDQRVLEFCLELCKRIKGGQVVLVHCW